VAFGSILPSAGLDIPLNLRDLPVNQTHGGALTVAGQWRIFTAFPNIRRVSNMKLSRPRKTADRRLPARTILPEASFIKD